MIFCAVGLLAASAAMAGVPSAGTSTQPAAGSILKVLGHTAVPDPAGSLTWTIRDASSNPVPGSVVVLNMAACTDVHLCATDQAAGFTSNCGAHTITGITNGAGQVTFAVVGASGSGVTIFANHTPCIAVTADGVALNSLKATTADYQGASGVDGLDVGAAFGDQVSYNTNPIPGNAKARSDFNNDSAITGLDVGAVYGVQAAHGSLSSCTAGQLCP
jgi:hypothetical protein